MCTATMGRVQKRAEAVRRKRDDRRNLKEYMAEVCISPEGLKRERKALV